MEIPDTLAHRHALFRAGAYASQAAYELFRVESWVQVMLGQGIEPHWHHAVGQLMRPEQLREALSGITANIQAAVAKLPEHQALLDGYYAAATVEA
jgi:tryptophan halogenase